MMRMITSSQADKRSTAAFTVLELLAVIAIILALAGLILPAVSKARTAARKTAARTEIKQIETAWTHYFAEYQAWPGNVDGTTCYPIAKDMANLLEGSNVWNNANPKRISFMHFTRINAVSNPISPWGNRQGASTDDSYFCRFDADYDNTIPAAPAGGPTNQPPGDVHRSVIVWTVNQDARTNDADYIIGSWKE